jgi:hypothetical protein
VPPRLRPLIPAEQRARSRMPPLIEYSARRLCDRQCTGRRTARRTRFSGMV